MRRIVTFNRVSADGSFAGHDGGLDWVVPEDGVDRAGVEGMASTDAILFGRRTYQLFEQFWPRALDASPAASDPHRPGVRSEAMRAMAVWLDATPKWVFSRSLDRVGWRNSHLVRELDPRRVEAMKRESGGDIIVFGSGQLVSQLTGHGLVDEYRFVVGPVLLGGRPLIEGLAQRVPLVLREARTYPSGNVMLCYGRAA